MKKFFSLRHSLFLLLTIFGFVIALTVFKTNSAIAQVSPQPVVTLEDVARKQSEAQSTAKKIFLNSKEYAITTALVSAVDTMTQRLAANAATWLVSGGNGQSALAYITEWQGWENNIMMDSVSDTLNQLSVKYAGFGLCQPINPKVSLRIKLGIARMYAPKPTCSFNTFWSTNGLEALQNNYTSGKFLENISAGFEMGQSSLSVALNTPYAVVDKAVNKTLAAAKERATSPFKAVTDPITGNVKTPSTIVEAAIKYNTVDAPAGSDAYAREAVTNKTDLFAAVGGNALKIFTSTLTQKVLDKYLKNGILTGKDVVCASSAGKSIDLCKGIVNEGMAGGGTGAVGVSLASAYFSSIFSPEPSTIEDYSPIPEMSSCPDGVARGIWNCVIDGSFVSALSGRDGGYLTIREAVKPENGNLLHSEWRLVPPTDSLNNDSKCYQSAYCYNNLVKLRRMRIIPVGWELAALASSDNGGSVTLGEAIKGFTDPTSPYYRLVDPDWILKTPITQCRAEVNGPTLVATNTDERAKVCVDSPSCIKEGANGRCEDGYGYCTREHSVWQIDAQECPAQFSTCNSYTDTTGKNLSVLSNTVDASYCSASNSGCKPYATIGTNNGWSSDNGLVFLNSQSVSCNESDEGCKELSRVKTASNSNILPNPGLEIPNQDGSMATSWTKDWEDPAGPSVYVRDGVSSFEGIGSYLNNGTLSLGGYHNLGGTVDIPVEPNKQYTLSYYARRATVANNGQLEIKLFDRPFIGPANQTCPAYPSQGPKPTCVADLSLSAMLPVCSTTASLNFPQCSTAPGGDYGPSNPNGEIRVVFPLNNGYERYSVTFATTDESNYIGLHFSTLTGGYYLDALQLELGATATAFHTGGQNGAGENVNIKVPPDYLGCTGEPELDKGKACGKFAGVCRQSEVGCDSFTSSAGGTAITAVVSSNDYCSGECVGYNTFKQKSTTWEAEKFPLYLIPKTATACQLSEVGCDEFTNLAIASAGGEAQEYYTAVRACRQPDPSNDGTYFTWEGSDASGFQLKSYTLRNNALGGDNTIFNVANTSGVYFVQNLTAGSGTTPSDRGPVYLTGTNPASCTQAIYRPTGGAASLNPDCREFVDATGNVFYRLLSATVASTTECQTYRKTVSTQTDCTGSGGTWNTGANSCEYSVYSAQSKKCRAQANGCRAYVGNQGNNSRSVIKSDFENNNLGGWTGGVISSESTMVGGHSFNGTIIEHSLAENNASIIRQGNLYTLTFWAKGVGTIGARVSVNGDITTIATLPANNVLADESGTRTPIATLTTEWQRYSFGPIAIGWTPNINDRIRINIVNGTGGYFDNIELTETQDQFALVKNSWKTPTSCDQTPAGQPLPQAQLGCSEYSARDNQTVNLKSFDHLCRQSSVGCEAFTDNHGTESQFASYNNVICTITSGGVPVLGDCLLNGKKMCTVLQNETSCRFNFEGTPAFQLVNYSANGLVYNFNYTAKDVYVVPADSTRYLVNDGKKTCSAEAVGCIAVGNSTVSKLAVCTLGAGTGVRPCLVGGVEVCSVAQGQTSCSYRMPFAINGTTSYKTIKPSTLKNQLCVNEAVGCQTWTSGNGSTYFKDPGEALCEYQEKTKLNGVVVSGWFKKGTQEPCDPTFAVGGVAYGVRKNGDPTFAPNKFAGVCKPEFAGCTEFTDHSDTGVLLANGRSEFPQGRPLYYVKDSKIDSAVSKCDGVSKKQGCLALDETSNPTKTINTTLTNAESEANGFELVKPISNDANDANIVLKVKRDRVCTEWLECSTEQMVTENGREVARCLSVSTCVKKGDDGRCITWGSLASGFPVLNNANYANRDVTSSGSDYSGYSIPNLPPVFAFRQQTATQLNVGGTLTNQSCRAYPEADAPFAKSVLQNKLEKTSSARQTGYDSVNVCEADSITGSKDCECSYRKVVYGNAITKYFPTTAETGVKADTHVGEIKNAICSGGPYDGEECVVMADGNRTATNLTCVNGNQSGSCITFNKIDSILGQKGYCLEKDKTLSVNGGTDQACVTWFPIDSPKGLDTANQFTSAAFIPKIGQERYCAAPAKYCVARDCTQPNSVTALCTTLKATTISYPAQAGDQFIGTNNPFGRSYNTQGQAILNPRTGNCFDACNRGTGPASLNSECLTQQNQCGNIVKTFCDEYEYETTTSIGTLSNNYCRARVITDPSCSTDDLIIGSDYCQDMYTNCLRVSSDAYTFCRNMEVNDCFDSYGINAQCSHDLPGLYYNDSFAGYRTNPLYNTSSFCGVDGYTQSPLNPSAALTGGLDLNSCSTTGTQFCGNDEVCSAGNTCLEMGSLTVNQDEFTTEETQENYGCSSTVVNNVKTTTCTTGVNTPVSYSTMPGYSKNFTYTEHTHTMFGAVNPTQMPMLSSSSLKFALKEASGDWISIKSDVIYDDDGEPTLLDGGKNAQNIHPDTRGDNPIIGSYPLDFVGMYYYGKSNSTGVASVSYNLTTPSLLLLSQIDRISIKVFSDAGNGLCQYGARATSGVSNFGACADGSGNYKVLSPKSPNSNYGYNVVNGNASDDARFTPKFEPSYVTLAPANNWSYQLTSNEGTADFTLIVSDTEPKRIIGIKVDLIDNSNRGYIYISSFDAHLAGQVCGEAVYIGSSNPTAEANVAVANTNAVNTIYNFTRFPVIGGSFKSSCSPWGAFAITNPFTVVSATPIGSEVCELAKGAVYAGVVELQKLFRKAFSASPNVGLFNSSAFDYLLSTTGLTTTPTSWLATQTTAVVPTINPAVCTGDNATNCYSSAINAVSLNNTVGGRVVGHGSVRGELKFFAEANGNQMPIKKININWGDGSDIVDSGNNNYYKNHIGLPEGSTGSPCLTDPQADGASFGRMSGSCDPKPFIYSHVYGFNDSCATPAPEAYPEAGIQAGDPVCMFGIPLVTITDNWGSTNTASGPQVIVGR